jgi:hypothetical protein
MLKEEASVDGDPAVGSSHCCPFLRSGQRSEGDLLTIIARCGSAGYSFVVAGLCAFRTCDDYNLPGPVVANLGTRFLEALLPEAGLHPLQKLAHVPPAVRKIIVEYVNEKAASLYGHSATGRRNFVASLSDQAMPLQRIINHSGT